MAASSGSRFVSAIRRSRKSGPTGNLFDLVRVQDALKRKCCRDVNGEEPWACGKCDHTDKLERKLAEEGHAFLDLLRRRLPEGSKVSARPPT